MVLDNGSTKVSTCKVAPGAAGGAHGRSGIMLAAGLPALHGSEPGQVRKEAATAILCKCRGQGSPFPCASGRETGRLAVAPPVIMRTQETASDKVKKNLTRWILAALIAA